MDKSTFFLPQGTKDFLPERAERMAEIEEALFEVFRSFGFRRIITPSFELLDVISIGMGEALKEAAFKFNDRASGGVMAISPDITPQVARMVATRMKELPRPLRLFYGGRVLRDWPGATTRSREVFQAGVELIGLVLPEADAEMIAMAIECLKRLGLGEFKIDVGQVEFVRGILREAHLPVALEREVRQAMGKKDLSTLETLLEEAEVNARAREIILSLLSLNGGREVLDKAADLTINAESQGALDNLRQVIDLVESYGLADFITIDLGEIRGFDYHTGVILEGFVPGQGFEVLSGGRYDTLLKKYGYDCPATGFALNLEALLLALEAQGQKGPSIGVDFLLINLKPSKREALAIARGLRQQGFRVARDIIKRDVAGSLDYARRNQIESAIILGREGCPEDEVVVKKVEGGQEIKVKIAKLLAGRFSSR